MLECFLTIAEEQNVTRAAQILHISQPALSRQLSQLEQELGCTLFERGKRKMELTDDGILLHRRAKEIISLVSITEEEIKHRSSEIEGRVGIGAGELSASEELAAMVGEFSKDHPKVVFEIFSGDADQVSQRIDSGLLDIGLFLEPVDKEKFEYLKMGEGEHWVACMAPDNPLSRQQFVTASDLGNRALLLPSRLGVQSELAHWFGSEFENIDARFVSSVGVNGQLLVKKGFAVSVTTEGHAKYLDGRYFVYRPLRPAITSGVVLAWKRDVARGAAARAFIDYVRGRG